MHHGMNALQQHCVGNKAKNMHIKNLSNAA